MIEGNSFVVNYLGFNQEVPLWKDVRVRQAVMHAINRDAIVQSLYRGAAEIANCGYVADHLLPSGIDAYAYDPEKAKQLLAEAGWDKINGSKPIPLLTYYNTPLASNVLAAVQAMLAQVGINVVPRAVDTPTYNATIYAQSPDWSQFPLVYAGLQNGPDPSAINIGLNEKQIPPAGANFLRIRMPERHLRLRRGDGRDRRCQAAGALPGRLQGDERQPALGHHVGGQALRRRLGQAEGFRLDPGPGRRPLRRPSGEMGRSPSKTHLHKAAAGSRS